MSIALTLNDTVIEIVSGDISNQDTDAVVNAANNHLWMGSGVAGALKRKGGQEIEDEAVSKGPIPVGEAVATAGGKLAARYVIHAAAMGQDLRTDEEKIRAATKNCLLRAEELGLKSISFPSLGTGVGGFPLEDAARVMLGVAIEHAKGDTCLKLIRFVLWGEEAYNAYARNLEEEQ